jgi:acyl-coenzyme A synthetase/AMP-(fatty) acid ligase
MPRREQSCQRDFGFVAIASKRSALRRNEQLGEEVKAVVQLMPGFEPGPALAAEPIAFCRENLAHPECPRSIDFEARA